MGTTLAIVVFLSSALGVVFTSVALWGLLPGLFTFCLIVFVCFIADALLVQLKRRRY